MSCLLMPVSLRCEDIGRRDVDWDGQIPRVRASLGIGFNSDMNQYRRMMFRCSRMKKMQVNFYRVPNRFNRTQQGISGGLGVHVHRSGFTDWIKKNSWNVVMNKLTFSLIMYYYGINYQVLITWFQFWKSHCGAHSFHPLGRITSGTRIYASVNWVRIGLGNGLSPVRCQAIILSNTALLSIGPLGMNFNEILIKIQFFSFTKMHMNISSARNGGHFDVSSLGGGGGGGGGGCCRGCEMRTLSKLKSTMSR